MRERMLQPKAAWAEDRATQRCDPSADPGAKTGAWASHSLALLPFYLLRDWHGSDKPSRHDAATLLAGCLPQLANAKRQEFQFPLNQDTELERFVDVMRHGTRKEQAAAVEAAEAKLIPPEHRGS